MKILAIRGKNLASLSGEFAVALEEGPLSEVGLFAITGPTGAGKSTLLDALCLALYDAVPRLVDGSGAAVGRAEESEELRLRGNDVRGLLRRGTADGFAEADFLGGDGKRYRARWEVRRARNRPTGRLQAQSLSLCDLESGQFLGRTKTEVLEAIEERLGLSFEQFRRSALLAQGDFAAFLKSRPAERSELLERITGTEIYGAISRAAHARAAEEKGNLRAMEERLGDLRPLDPNGRSDLERRCEEAAAALCDAEGEKGRLQTLLEGHLRLKELRGGEARAEEALGEAEAAREGAALRRSELEKTEQAQPLRGAVQQCDAAEGDLGKANALLEEARQEHRLLEESVAREEASLAELGRIRQEAQGELARLVPLIRQARDLDVRIGEAKGSLATACAESAALAERAVNEKAALEILLAARAEARQIANGAEKWLDEHGGDAVLSRQWDLWDGEFRRYARGVNELHGAEGELKRLRDEESRLEEEMRRIASLIESADASLRELEEKRERFEGEVASFCPDDLAMQREELERRRERLRVLGEVAREVQRLREERSGLAASLEEERHRGEAAFEEGRKSGEALTGIRAALLEARRALESARTARKEEVESLRACLREGEACPVCGALDHPWAVEGVPLFDRLIDEQGGRVLALEREESALAKKFAEAEANREAALRQAREKGRRLTELESDLHRSCERWSALDPAREAIDAKDALPELAFRMEETERAAALLREREKKEQECRRILDEVRRDFEKVRRSRDEAQAKALGLRPRMQETSTKGGAAQSAIAAASRVCREALEALSDPLGPPENWERDLKKDPKEFFVACRERADRWRREEIRKAEAEKKLQELAPECAAAETRCRHSDAACETAGKSVAVRQEALQKLTDERRSLLDGEEADAVERRLESAVTGAEDALEGARALCAEAHRRLAAAAQTLVHRESESIRRAADRDDKRSALDEALAAAGWQETVLRRLLERPAEWLGKERRALDALEAQCREALVLLRERREQTAAHLSAGNCDGSQEEAAALLQEATARLTAARDAWVAAEGERREDDRRRTQAGRLQEELARLRERWNIWESLRELIGSADGSKFRSFAQSLTLDALLAHANRHLDDLARRYALERVPGSDLELQVIDREMGDEVRPVHSLSGGESFLVSLALALALASLSSHRTQVESLFIDEGFGSLDPDTLDTAVASLDALQSLGRKVGVISHVPALVERIGVQVRVESLGSGRSRVRVIGGSSAPALKN
jgi:DNA repair protein SbcC/Rad50